MNNLAEILIAFLQNIPDTIRSGCILQIRYLLSFALGLPSLESQYPETEMLNDLAGMLRPNFSRIGALVATCSMVDYHFQTQIIAQEESLDELMDAHIEEYEAEFGDTALEEAKLRRPLIRMHTKKAAMEWAALRTGEISIENIFSVQQSSPLPPLGSEQH